MALVFKPSIKLEGTRDLREALLQLEGATAKRITRKAMKYALEPVAEHARGLVPVEEPNRQRPQARHLRETIGVSDRLTPRQRKQKVKLADVEMYVGVRGPHAHLVEFGTKERHQKSGKSVGAMPRRPFLRPAWDAQMSNVWQRLVVGMRNELARIAARAAKRAKR
jgi:HK97 gp10 family phage protein